MGLKITIEEVEPGETELGADVEIHMRPLARKRYTKFLAFSGKEAQRALARAVDQLMQKEEGGDLGSETQVDLP